MQCPPQEEGIQPHSPHRWRKKISYIGEVGTPRAELLLIKIMLNSVISTPEARFMTIDISKFYLNTPMTRYDYLKLKLSNIPDKIIKLYNLKEKATTDGSVYMEIRKGVYGLPQAGLITNELLEKRPAKHKYTQSKLVMGI